jgi:hypothetical protein
MSRCKCGRFTGDAPCRLCRPFAALAWAVRDWWRARCRERRVARRVSELWADGRGYRLRPHLAQGRLEV